jgi:hypothetical protein
MFERPEELAFKTHMDDLRFAPAYNFVEAAHYLRMPPETLRSWVVGRFYPVAGKKKRSKPLVTLDDPSPGVHLAPKLRGTSLVFSVSLVCK